MKGYVAEVNRDKKDIYTTIENLKSVAAASGGSGGPGGSGKADRRGLLERRVWSGLKVFDPGK